jgi:ATP-dependent DNA helicase RecQ
MEALQDDNPPPPSHADAPAAEPTDRLTAALRTTFGLDHFRPMQREVVEDVLAGRDVLCVMPTGAGKSLCYQLPAVVQGGLSLVVSPLISLMENQTGQLRDAGIACHMLNSNMPPQDVRQALSDLENGFEGLLYVAPERFAIPGFRRLIESLPLKLFAIDEAHCISQWGHDFRPDYQQLGEVREMLGRPPTIALTATATAEVRDDIARTLDLDDPSVVVTGFDRPNLRYECQRTRGKRAKLDGLVNLASRADGSTIVYCATRKKVDEVTTHLSHSLQGRPVFSYHGGMDAAARTENQERWLRTPRGVAVATNAFGMGINKPDVRLVAHYNTPGCLEAYYQEAGRAGRDGQPARCVLLFSYEDRFTQEYFIDNIKGADDADPDLVEEIKRRERDKLDRMIGYASTWRCRRQQILDYFGDAERIDPAKCRCDACRSGTGEVDDEENVVAVDDATAEVVRKLLSGVARQNNRAGVGTVAEVLTGSSSEKVTGRGLDGLKSYGLLAAYRAKQVIAMLHRLIETGLVQQNASDGDPRFKVIKLSPSGVRVMKSQAPVPTPLTDLIPRRVTPTRAGSAAAPIELDAESRDGFQRLKKVRSDLARERGLPAYCICNDRTLRSIAADQPQDASSLAAVKGMGPRKVAMYGDALLAALHDQPAEDGPRFLPDADAATSGEEWPSRT